MLSKWMPRWLAANYFKLWVVKERAHFGFDEGMDILKANKEMAWKTFSQLEGLGYLIKERSEVDSRSKVYRLIPPEDILFAQILEVRLPKRLPQLSLNEKLSLIADRLPYLIIGSHAAFFYHRYMTPPSVVEMKVKGDDVGKWIALLTDKRTHLFLDRVFETRRHQIAVKLCADLTEREYGIRNTTLENIFIEPLESSILTMIGKNTSVSLIEVIAQVLVNWSVIDWQKVILMAQERGLLRELGCLLDIINWDAAYQIIGSDLVRKILGKVKGKVDQLFPDNEVTRRRLEEIRARGQAFGALLSEREALSLLERRFYT